MLLLTLLLLQAPPPQPIPYFDPTGRLPSTYEDYAAERVDEPCIATTVARTGGTDDELVVVFVNAGLLPGIQSRLDTWLADIAAEGFSGKVIEVSGGRPSDLRGILQAHRDSGLVGALMVGDLPVAWWEQGAQGEDYPLELFFTDLDGTFADNDGDGKYDNHSGSRAPDIWVGRVYASRLTYGCEEKLVRDWFDRNHAYRSGGLIVPHRGLVYNEVTWYPNDHGMGNLYSDVTMYNNANTTTAHHYKNELRLGYEFVHVIAHSSPWVHTFFLAGDEPGGGSVFNFEVPALEPNASFYFLNACMCARFTEKDNLGNWYLFARPWSQAVIASTRLMYGLSSVSTFYSAVSNDDCIGEAFLQWHQGNYSMYHGTCMLGDPTLRIDVSDPQLCPPATVRRPEESPRGGLDWTDYPLDSSDFVNGNPDIDCSGSDVRIVFDSGRKVRADTYWSWFNGSQFSQPESVAWHEYYDLFPACATDATGRFWVVWQSFRDYSSYDHFQLRSSYYHGGNWSSVGRVGPQAGYHDIQAALDAGSDDRVWCAFKSWRNGQADIWVSSAQSGGSWSSPTRLTDDSLGQVSPCVVVDSDDHPWVFWSSLTDGNWRIHGRHHNGTTWSSPVALDTVGNNSCPRAAAGNDGTVWVTWHKWDGNQLDVYYTCWTGSEWTAPGPVTDDQGDDILADVCVGPDDEPWVCWQSDRTGHWDIYTSSYADGWTTPDPVTTDDASDYDPVIGASGTDIWIAWATDRRGYWNIHAARTDLTGISGQEPMTPATRLEVSPNPFARQATFRGDGEFRVEVFAPDGRRVSLLHGRDGRATWRPQGIESGLYIARVTGRAGTETLKLVHLR